MARDYMKRIPKMLIIMICLILFISYSIPANAKGNNYTNDELKTIIEEIYNRRSNTFVTGDLSILQNDFDASGRKGKWAQQHEIKRIRYLHDWAAARGIKFTNVTSTIRITKVFPQEDSIRAALQETYKFDYIYPKDSVPETNSFGVGIRHNLGLVEKDNRLIIAYDWYTDCFEDALKSYDGNITAINPSANTNSKLALNLRARGSDYLPARGRYNRLQAVQYAHKYCGAANGEGNNFKYNKKYRDFNGAGGDCTNFASQVLGDPEAGGIKHDSKWWFVPSKYGRGGSSDVWVNADSFRSYLISSGKGLLIKKGTFKDLALPQSGYPYGVIDKLDLGDLICYAKGKNMDHFAIITGWDSHGYPLVNSHTTDRYRVPWDLGWGDKNIYFHLIHIR